MSQTRRPSELWIALLARLCASWLDSRRSWMKSTFRNCSEVALISLVIWPYCPIDSSWMLRIALMQSLATMILWSRRSLASAKPSLHAIASKVSGSDIPENVTVEAPRKRPVLSHATAATEAELEFLEVAASTLILARPEGGGIHLGIGSCLCCRAFWTGFTRPSSAINRSTK